jgi:hypothetical protein
MNLVEEENRPLSVRAQALACARQNLTHLSDGRGDGRELDEFRAGHARDDPGQRRLAAARRPVEDRRADPVLFDRQTERRACAQDVLLSDELVQRLGPHSESQRCDFGQPLLRRI